MRLAAPSLRAVLVASAVLATGACGAGSGEGRAPVRERDLLAAPPERVEGFPEGEEPRSGSLVLVPGARAVWRVEEGTATALVVAGALEDASGEPGRGAFSARLFELAPDASGRAPAQRPLLRVPGRGGRIEGTIPLPASRTGVLELQLGLDVAEGTEDVAARLVVERLALVGPGLAERPHVVFVSIDTLAARRMSVYGYERETTPRLEEFAAEAVLFERCATNAPWTLPSYLSLFAGLWPSAMRVAAGGTEDTGFFDPRWRLTPKRWTLAEMMRAAGYRTAAFLDNPWLDVRHGLAQGFEVYDTSAVDVSSDDPDGGIRLVNERALAWLDALPAGAPAFLFLQAIDPHAPYLPDGEFRGLYGSDEETEPLFPAGGVLPSFGAIPRVCHLPLGAPLPERLSLAACSAAYDEEVRMTDAAIGALFDELRARGIWDDALVIVHSDHGEAFLDHGFLGHGTLFEDVLHVPLLIRFPGGRHGGTRVAASVQSVDLYPTLMDLVGIAPHREYLHGRSLLPLVRGEDEPPRATFSEQGIMLQASIEEDGWKLIARFPGGAPVQTMLSSPWLPDDVRARFPELADGGLTQDELDAILERWGGEEALAEELRAELPQRVDALYHLPSDPDERTDLAAEHPEELERLDAKLQAIVEKTWASVDLTDLEAPDLDLEPDRLEELRKLGYF